MDTVALDSAKVQLVAHVDIIQILNQHQEQDTELEQVMHFLMVVMETYFTMVVIVTHS
jgi:hypothetical protein